MKKSIIKLLLFLLKKLGYKEPVRPIVIKASEFHRLDFKLRESMYNEVHQLHTLTYLVPFMQDRILEQVCTALKDRIEINRDTTNKTMDAQLTIYTRMQ